MPGTFVFRQALNGFGSASDSITTSGTIGTLTAWGNDPKWLSGKEVQIFIKNNAKDVFQVDSTNKAVLADGDSSTNTIPSDDPLNPKGYISIQPGTPGNTTFDMIFSPLAFRVLKYYFQEMSAYPTATTSAWKSADWEISVAWYARKTASIHVMPRCKITSITSDAADTSGSNQQPMTVNFTDMGGVGSMSIDIAAADFVGSGGGSVSDDNAAQKAAVYANYKDPVGEELSSVFTSFEEVLKRYCSTHDDWRYV